MENFVLQRCKRDALRASVKHLRSSGANKNTRYTDCGSVWNNCVIAVTKKIRYVFSIIAFGFSDKLILA